MYQISKVSKLYIRDNQVCKMSQVYTVNILDALPYTYLCTLAHCLLEWGLEGPIEAQDIPYVCWTLSRISHISQSHKPSLHNLDIQRLQIEREMKDVRLSYVLWGYAAEKYQQKLISFVKLYHHGYIPFSLIAKTVFHEWFSYIRHNVWCYIFG